MAAFIQAEINGVEVNLIPSDSSPITLDIIVTSPGNFREDAGNLSQEFTFARTAANAALFDYWGDAGATQVPGLFDVIQGASIRNQNETLGFGSLQLNSVTLEGDFVCSFEDQTVSLAKSLAEDGKTIATLDPTGCIVPYNIEAIGRSWVSGTGLQTPSVTVCGTWQLFGDEEFGVTWYYQSCEGEHRVIAIAAGLFSRIVVGNTSQPRVRFSDGELGFDPALLPTAIFTRASEGGDTPEGATTPTTDAIDQGTVAYPLVDLGWDGSTPVEQFGFISTAQNTIHAGDTVAGSFANPFTPAVVQQFTPTISVPTIIRKIFAAENATFESSFIDTFCANLHALSKVQEGLGIQTDTGREGVRRNGFSTGIQTSPWQFGIHGTAFTSGSPFYNIQRIGSGLSVDLNVQGAVTVSGDAGFIPQWQAPTTNIDASGRSVVTATGSYEVQARFRIIDIDTSDLGSSRDWQQWTWQLRPLDAAGNLITGYEEKGIYRQRWGRNDTTLDLDETITVTLQVPNMPEGGGFEFVVYSDRRRGISNLLITMDNFIFGSTQEPESWDNIDANPFMQFDPSLTRGDFMLAWFQKFNIKYWPDKRRRNHFFFEHYNDWLNAGPTPDWNDKLAGPIGRASILDEVPGVLEFIDSESDDVLSTISRDTFPRKEIGSTSVFSPSTKSTAEQTVGDILEPLATASIGSQDPTLIEYGGGDIPHLYELEDGEKNSNRFGIRFGWITPTRPTHFPFYLARITEDPDDFANNYYKTITPFQTVEVGGTSVTVSTLWDLDPEYPMSVPDGARSAEDFFYGDYRRNLYKEDNEIMRCQLLFTEEEFKSIEENSKPYIDGQRWIIRSIKNFTLEAGQVLVDAEFSKFYDNHDSLTESIAAQVFSVSGVDTELIDGDVQQVMYTLTVPNGHEISITSPQADVSITSALNQVQVSFDQNSDAERIIDIVFTDQATGQSITRTLLQLLITASARSTTINLNIDALTNSTATPEFAILNSGGSTTFAFLPLEGYEYTTINQLVATGGTDASVTYTGFTLVNGELRLEVNQGSTETLLTTITITGGPSRVSVTTPTIAPVLTISNATVAPELEADRILSISNSEVREGSYVITPDIGFEFRTANATIADRPFGFLIGQRLVDGNILIDIVAPAEIMESTNTFTLVAAAQAVPASGGVDSITVTGSATIDQPTGNVTINVTGGGGNGNIVVTNTSVTDGTTTFDKAIRRATSGDTGFLTDADVTITSTEITVGGKTFSPQLQGGGITTVAVGTGLTGDGTSGSPLNVVGLTPGAEANVNANWLSTSGDSFIENKPTSFPPEVHSHSATEITAGTLIDTVLVGDQNTTDGIRFWTGTSAQLPSTRDSRTLYIIIT